MKEKAEKMVRLFDKEHEEITAEAESRHTIAAMIIRELWKNRRK